MQRVQEIKNPYGLQIEFPTLEAAQNYLENNGFLQHHRIHQAWNNPQTAVNAHTAKVREFSGAECYIATYHASHVESQRGSLKPVKRPGLRLVKELDKQRVNYGG